MWQWIYIKCDWASSRRPEKGSTSVPWRDNFEQRSHTLWFQWQMVGKWPVSNFENRFPPQQSQPAEVHVSPSSKSAYYLKLSVENLALH